jgi:general secretion pathway protein G
MKQLLHLRKGFTLVEVLVVMSIMGVLVAIGMYGYQASISHSRDQRRKADLVLVQGALENYKANDPNSSYPYTASGATGYASLEQFLVPNYLPSLPNDPFYSSSGKSGGSGVGGSAASYSYNPVCEVVNSTNVCKAYTLSATLENGSVNYEIDQNGVSSSSSQQEGSPNGL